MITLPQRQALTSVLNLPAVRAVADGDRIDSDGLVLFGAGLRGRRVLSGLRKRHREPLAFCDNNEKLHGTVVDGLPVLSATEAASLHPDATYIVTIWSDRIGYPVAAVRAQLGAFGIKNVTSFTSIYDRWPDEFLPEFFLDRLDTLRGHDEAILEAAELWNDDASRVEFIEQLRARITLDLAPIDHATTTPAYFPDLFTVSSDEVFVDCGAFDGDSYRAFAEVTHGRFRDYFGIEPDSANFAKLQDCVAAVPRDRSAAVTLLEIGVAEKNMVLRFSAAGSAESRISDSGAVKIECRTLDDVLQGVGPTYIKMDIEGAEAAALAGGRTSIQRSRPILAVSAYHRVDDLWNIPRLIASMVSDYTFHLRPEKRAGWDLLCYAIPRERLKS
jgi:FkbM family methyltransferase